MGKRNLLIGLVIAVVILALVVIWVVQKNKLKTEEANIPSEHAMELQDMVRFADACDQVVIRAQDYIEDDPDDVGVWFWKGSCEYRLREYDAAKTSLENVLRLNPNHLAAKTYIEQIEKVMAGESVPVNPIDDFITAEYVESKLGIDFNRSVFQYVTGTRLPYTPGERQLGADRFTASFSSTRSIAEVVTALKTEFGSEDVSYEEFTQGEDASAITILSVRMVGEDEQFRGYSVTLSPLGSDVDVAVFYEN